MSVPKQGIKKLLFIFLLTLYGTPAIAEVRLPKLVSDGWSYKEISKSIFGLALAAGSMTYEYEDIIFSGPLLRSVEVKNQKVYLYFLEEN
ncbi:hypothetical protein [Fodinibius salsisoli]|uniref:Uncharacterized protein n=1 Tax=Fodinibius salsisoli TaxID=2820877 RepID=A0ABT3PKC4_9BACT|nr:hypothetical protein [Fodinibius salsisoli]MCW9706364.1 hypothetical protein [Fodinibius salsisoli]